MMRTFLPLTILFGVLAMVGNVFAQGQTSSSGTFGNRTLGSSLSGGQRTFGSNPTSGSRTTADLSSVGQLDSGDRFVRGNRQPGQFVGGGGQDLQNFIGAVQGNQGAGGQNRAGSNAGRAAAANRSGNANRSANANRSQSAGRDEIRAKLRIAFPYTKTVSTELGAQLAARLVRMPQVHTLSPLEIRVVGDTATLQGMVATDYDRGLVERLVRLEAGVWKVNNELVVAQAVGKPKSQTPAPLPKPKPAEGSATPPRAEPFLGGLFRVEPPQPKGPATKAPAADLPPWPPGEDRLIRPEPIPGE